MKRILALSMVSVLLLSLPTGVEAQIWKKLKNKAKEAAEKKLEEKAAEALQKKAEQMVENYWDSIFGDISQDSASGKLPFTFNSNVKTEDNYHFDVVTTMEVETVKGNGESEPPATLLMHFNKNEMYTGTKFVSEDLKKENGDLFIIYDFKNEAMLMLMSSDDDKFSIAYDWKQAVDLTNDSLIAKEEEVNWDEANNWHGYSRIGQKNIAGYSCEGYQSQNDEIKTEIWVTRDEGYGMGNMFRANSNTKQLKGKLPEDYPYGMVMEMVSEDLESGDKTIMRVTDIQKNADVNYKMADYPALSLSQKMAEN
ncbi:MAG: DUF4412 domain-containing protein [Balneolaceae bacterium]|jgi:hypothetical protein